MDSVLGRNDAGCSFLERQAAVLGKNDRLFLKQKVRWVVVHIWKVRPVVHLPFVVAMRCTTGEASIYVYTFWLLLHYYLERYE
jgi:hypothetical protein